MNEGRFQQSQCDKCADLGAEFVPIEARSRVGISLEALAGETPINGLRIRPDGSSSGWFVYSGVNAPSSAEDFYKPIHLVHLITRLPQIVPFLGLPPGWRFLLAEDYEDAWFDRNLLD
jgi:hypothetical protein